jgi:molybdopterin/thiamine biosynthesis adenylyltransferase
MPGKHHHEELFRGSEAMERLGKKRVVLCGAGAIGSNLADTLARQGVVDLLIIDRDRVEEHNISTQIFCEEDVGAKKAEVVANRIYDAVGAEVDTVDRELTASNVGKHLGEADLVIDGFDNHASRELVTSYCRDEQISCLHAGLAADYAEVLWNDSYRVPADAPDGPDVCDYPMARNLIGLCVAVAAEVLVRFVVDGLRESYTITLADLRINREQR